MTRRSDRRGRSRAPGRDLQRRRRRPADERRDRCRARPPPSGVDALRPAVEDAAPGSSRWRARSASSSRRLREATGWAPRVRAGTDGWACHATARGMTAAERFARGAPAPAPPRVQPSSATSARRRTSCRRRGCGSSARRGVDRGPRRLADDGRRPARARHAALRPRAPRDVRRPVAARAGRVRARTDPADRVTLDESVSYALLTVLEQLSPAERTAFVLHDVFDVPFGEVAEVVGRTPEAVAAARLARPPPRRASERPRFAASPRRARRAVRAFAQAVAEGDLEGLVAVLDPDVVWTSDGGGRATAARKPLRGGGAGRARVGGAQPQVRARTDRDRAQRAARAGALERRRPSRGALVRRRRRSHRAHRRDPQPGEAAAPLADDRTDDRRPGSA